MEKEKSCKYKVCMKTEFIHSVSAKDQESAINTIYNRLNDCVDKVLDTEVMSIELQED